MSKEPVYILRLNGDPNLEAPVHHVEKVSPMEIEIKDKANFPPGSWPKKGVRLLLFELLDSHGTLYAMRRIPDSVNFIVTNAFNMEINWKLILIQSEDKLEFGSNG